MSNYRGEDAKKKSSGSAPKNAQKSSASKQPQGLETIIAFYIFFAAHFLAALYSPIQDCDEVFNYWEPTHYLNHGYGLQTWEYSPEYAIRSWTYAGLHAVIIFIGSFLPFVGSKSAEFYLMRMVFGFACAVCEARFYSAIAKTLNPRIAMMFLVALVTSPGMFHASISYLPSSFAMYGTMLGVTAFMDWKGGLRTAQGIMWFGIASCLGWPFAGALVLPFIAEELLLASMMGQGFDCFRRILDGTVRSLLALAFQVSIDVFFYKKLAVVPWNIVMYNVFSNKGPSIYGTEPWHFYIRNLVLNFTAWFPLALSAMPLLLLQHIFRRDSVSAQSVLRGLVFVSPFYLWLAIFTVQPHKEERFMYPIYPLIALNAAISLHILLSWLGSTDPKAMVSHIPAKLKLYVTTLTIIIIIEVSLLRTIGTLTAYSAPLRMYAPLRAPGVAQPGSTVCLGKEWYRFPSSYFLPNGMRAKFIKSEFSGLLPGEFREAGVGFGFYPGAWLVPSGMNDENVEDPGKYTDVEHCDYLVDSHGPSTTPTQLEPDYIADAETWEKVSCAPFLDNGATGLLGRLFWLPDWSVVPERHRRKWGEYCLLRRKSAATK